jgi:hypothetical protein
MKLDYLKYWKVIRNYFKIKYEISQTEMDMMLFLYSEQYFNKAKFDKFNNVMSWDRRRFDDLLKKGWIEIFRKRVGNKATLYKLSHKANRMVNDMYKKLNGDEISEDPKYNPLYRKNTRYINKVYRNIITEMNQEIRKKRAEAQEDQD